jgi:hypothetical protein
VELRISEIIEGDGARRLRSTRGHATLVGHGRWQQCERRVEQGDVVFVPIEKSPGGEERVCGGRRSVHAKGERQWRPFRVDRPSGSAKSIWALLGLSFNLRALMGLRVARPGARPNPRWENLGKGRVGLWAYSWLYPNSTLLKPLYILSAQNGGLT